MNSRNLKAIVGGRPKRLLRDLSCAVLLWLAPFCQNSLAADADSFPTPSEVFQGRTFTNETARDIFFLRAIHDKYPQHWPALLEANINEQQYIQYPVKMLRFVDELGEAIGDRNDPVAIASLRVITSDKKFYTNINAYHPEILRAAARALIKIGVDGRKALAESFSQSHYREDSESLGELAKTVGEERPADLNLAVALSATAFGFSTTNGGIFPRYTALAVENLLYLPQGPLAVKTHLNTNEIFADPVRFQSVVDGIASTRSIGLVTNLSQIDVSIGDKLATLKAYPGAYRDALEELHGRIQDTMHPQGAPKKKTKQN